MKHVGIEIKFYNLDTFKKQIGVNFIDLDSELVDLNGKVASLIFCHVWRSITLRRLSGNFIDCRLIRRIRTIGALFQEGLRKNLLFGTEFPASKLGYA